LKGEAHYVIQRVGSVEIIDMQRYERFEEAEKAAKESPSTFPL
jgi:hypothetical protein